MTEFEVVVSNRDSALEKRRSAEPSTRRTIFGARVPAVGALWAIMAGCTLFTTAGCGRSSRWADVELRASYAVDGRPRNASTTWRTRITNGFPSGSIETMKGEALVLGIDASHYVFGTFLEENNGQATESSIVTAIDSFVLTTHQRPGGGPVPDGKAAERDQALEEAVGARVPICRHEPTQRIQPPCLIFVTFGNSDDRLSMRRVVVGRHFQVAGRDVVINSVTIGFVPGLAEPSRTLPDLPWLKGPPNGFVAPLPADPEILFSHPMFINDFRRP